MFHPSRALWLVKGDAKLSEEIQTKVIRSANDICEYTLKSHLERFGQYSHVSACKVAFGVA